MVSRFRWTLTNLNDSTTEVLTKDPIGWEEMSLKLARHEEYHGVFIDFALSLKWHCQGGGKDFIDNVYNTEDINGNIEVLIEMDCDQSGTYSELYRGKIDLTKYQTDREYTTCSIEKSDLYSKLRARDEISVNLESTESIGGEAITAPALPTIQLHSQKIFLIGSMEGSVPFISLNPHANVADSILFRGVITHALTTKNAEAERFAGAIDYDDMALNGPSASASIVSEIFEAIDGNVEYPATYTYRVDFSGTFYDKVTGGQTRTNTAHSLVLAYGADMGTATFITLYTTSGYVTSLATYSEAFDTTPLTGTIPLRFGDKVWLFWFESETITTGPYLDKLDYEYHYDTAQFSIEIDSATAETECKVALIHEAFNQVVDSIADADVRFYSEFYGRTDSEKLSYAENGCGSLVAVTNGLNIRQFDGKQIFCSLRDLFKTFHAIHNIGLTIEQFDSPYVGTIDVIRVEQLSHFYDSTTEILALSRPVKIDISIDTKRYINSAIVGYDRWETEFKGGLDEPCTKHEYSTKAGVKSQIVKLSKYIASGYAIELTRRKNSNEEQTEDWRYDNEDFVIAVKNYYRGPMRFFASEGAVVISLPLGMIQDGDTIVITGTGSNDGTYTVDHSEAHPLGIAVYLVEAVVNETVTSAVLEDLTTTIYQPEKYADSFSGGSGMIQLDTAYNLRLTPARMLLAHVGIITACLQKIQGLIKFIKGEGNTTLALAKDDIGCQEDYSGEILTESDDIAWNEPNAANITPLWRPELLKFNYPLTLAEITTIRSTPNGYITVTDDHGTTYQGFVIDIDYKLKTGETQFELLRLA